MSKATYWKFKTPNKIHHSLSPIRTCHWPWLVSDYWYGGRKDLDRLYPGTIECRPNNQPMCINTAKSIIKMLLYNICFLELHLSYCWSSKQRGTLGTAGGLQDPEPALLFASILIGQLGPMWYSLLNTFEYHPWLYRYHPRAFLVSVRRTISSFLPFFSPSAATELVCYISLFLQLPGRMTEKIINWNFQHKEIEKVPKQIIICNAK